MSRNGYIFGALALSAYILFLFINYSNDRNQQQVGEAKVKFGTLINSLFGNRESAPSVSEPLGSGQDSSVNNTSQKKVDNQNSPEESNSPLVPVALTFDRSSPDISYRRLEEILQQDERSEYRLSAILELRALVAAHGDEGGRVQELFRISAATDGDARVAAAANEAYIESTSFSGVK